MSDDIHSLRAKFQRLKVLYDISTIIHSTLDSQEVLQLILREAVAAMNASSGSIVLLNPTSQFLEIHASHGLGADACQVKLKPGEGITGWVVQTGAPARVGDVRKDPRYVALRSTVRSELAVPLEINGEVRGAINLDSDRPDAFRAEDQELLQALASHAAVVIHNTWLYEQLRLKVRMFESLGRVGRAINSALNLDEALQTITREACQMMQARLCSLMLLDDTGEWLDLRASFRAGEAYLSKPRLSVAESFVGVVVRRKKPLQLENVQTSTQYQNVEVARREGLVALLSVPLIYGDRAIGTLNVYTDTPYSFSNEEIRILSALAELSAIALEKARLYERVVDVEEQLRRNEKLSALGLLAAEVAHEIRNPLTVIKMLYHSLGLEFAEHDPRSKDVGIIGRKIEQLNRIVERILDFARTPEPQVGKVNVNHLIEELALLVRHKLKQQRVELVRELDATLPAIEGDAVQLEQAFLNLTLNAVEAMPDGGTLTISTRVASGKSGEPACVRIDFKDTGHGMSDPQKRRAFKSVLATTRREGTGLGLPIVARVVESHRGRIKLQSRVGQGTTVSILLPAGTN